MSEERDDERRLWEALIAGEWPRDAGQRLGIPEKRVLYLCEKWAKRGKYEYGVSADLGWPVTRNADRNDAGSDQP